MSRGNQFRYWESSFLSIPTCMWPMHEWSPKVLAKPPSKSFFQQIQTSSWKTPCRNLITMLTTLPQSLLLGTQKLVGSLSWFTIYAFWSEEWCSKKVYRCAIQYKLCAYMGFFITSSPIMGALRFSSSLINAQRF